MKRETTYQTKHLAESMLTINFITLGFAILNIQPKHTVAQFKHTGLSLKPSSLLFQRGKHPWAFTWPASITYPT